MSKIDTLNITDDKIFKDSEVHFSYVNIIYGKNGTGKSTLAKKIKSEYQNQYDIRVFNGFESIVNSNETLDTITLGQKNNQIEAEIKKIEIEIQKVIEKRDNLGLDNCKSDINILKNQLDTSLTDKAREIKNKYSIINYTKKNLKRELDNLQGEKFDVNKQKEILNQEVLPKLENNFIKINELYCELKECVELTNNIVTRDITKESIHTFKSIEERKWVEQGIKLHKDNNGNVSSNCIFCNNALSDERIDQLSKYLDDSQKKLSNNIEKVKQSLSRLNLDFSDYIFEKKFVYPDFNDELNNLNTNIQKFITELNSLKNETINLLSEKEKNTFKDFTNKKIKMSDLIDKLSDLKSDCNNLVQENNDYTAHIDENKKDAENKLIQNELLDFNLEYELSKEKISDKEKEFKRIKAKEDALNLQIKTLESDKTEKLKETKNEQLAADFINQYLGDYFKLKKIPDHHQYIVKNIDGTTRSVSTLSKGEKNIVAFLWFIKNLDNVNLNNDNKKKIIIFDDPMDSNDDVMQYIMLSELSKLTDMFRNKKIIKNNNVAQLFIFTHNAHFYMNVKENIPKRNGNYESFILRKNNKITIEKLTEDINLNYDVLWQDAVWLFECNKPNLLLNNFRRIIENYITFNKIDKYDFYSKINSLYFKKLLDTNSHFVSEEMDSNPFTREELLKDFRDVFIKYDDLEHFNNHWKNE